LRPEERSDAATHFNSNQGWFSNILTSCCPTMPVAPNTPASILILVCTCSFKNCGLRIADCGFQTIAIRNPNSEIRN
jgi:hypothetical protein